MHHSNFVFFAALLLVIILAATSDVVADDNLTEAAIDKMSLKQLRVELKRRGVEKCDDCLEKEHFRARLKELIADPNVKVLSDEELQQAEKEQKQAQKPKQDDSASTTNSKPKMPNGIDLEALKASFRKKREDNAKMKEALKKAGIDTSQMKMSQDEEMMEKLFGSASD